MGDAVSCGLTQKIRSGLGYDDVVDKASLQYVGGQVAGTVVSIAAAGANPCQAAAGIKLAIKTVSAVQGVGQLANAADAAKNGDPLGFVLNVVGARMSFSKLGQACFAAGVPLYDSLTTAKPIDKFQVGDLVLSRDENNPDGLPSLKCIEDVFVGTARILHLHVGGEVLRTTAMHPFWVIGKGWVEAELLKPGDRLGSHDGQDVMVEELYDTGETETVYNLRIADYHTYFVGCPEWGWSAWAHNDCLPYNQLRRQTAGTNQQAHHLIEKRFAGLFGQKQGQMLSTPLSPTQHQDFTNAWRAQIPYGPLGTGQATRGAVEAAARRIYAGFPEYLSALGL